MSDVKDELEQDIQQASKKISQTWPLYSFVTSNPLSGLDDKPFREAIPQARSLFGGRGYPPAWQFRQALEIDKIDVSFLRDRLSERGLEPDIRSHLNRLMNRDEEKQHDQKLGSAERSLNQILEKWLSSFLDEGQSRWAMPHREDGFYGAWRKLAQSDHQIPHSRELKKHPESKYEAIREILPEVTANERQRIFLFHLATLPGWVGYIKQRNQRQTDRWSEKYPIDLVDYLAVRLTLADHLDATIIPESDTLKSKTENLDKIRECFLEAWEESYRSELIEELNLEGTERKSKPSPDAQLVFCIDTRSEIIRRHIESTGNYDTHGYAGFFGIPVYHKAYGEKTSVKACPPIVEPAHEVEDVPRSNHEKKLHRLETWNDVQKASYKALKNIKDNIASAFSYVEFSGLFYGLGMLNKTLFPGSSGSILKRFNNWIPDYHEVTHPNVSSSQHGEGISLDDKVHYAESAFNLMGWTSFANLVVFVGHSSQTSNNPFDSSLRCGACSGNSGAPSARMLASICNEDEVREELRKKGFDISDDTLFIAGKHNTTTDQISLLSQDIPETHSSDVESLEDDLKTARKTAAAERLESMPDIDVTDAKKLTEERASDWAQTRPEWGLAGNASFIVGPNRLRNSADLEGRAFLHSYDWETDPEGTALEQIIKGPVVVCQWINHQYYFSSVDNRTYGSGSKITHNPVGNFGVLQGNGGALMDGLPLQSVMKSDTELQHEPIRILMIIHAPYERVTDILQNCETVQNLVDNDWIALEVIDPTRNNKLIPVGQSVDQSKFNPPPDNEQASV